MKDRIEIIDGRKLYLVTEHETQDIGWPIQDILDGSYQILIGPLDGIFITVRTEHRCYLGHRCYMWQQRHQAEGWRDV